MKGHSFMSENANATKENNTANIELEPHRMNPESSKSANTNTTSNETAENTKAEQRIQHSILTDKELADLMMSNIIQFGRYSLELEEKREQSLINQSSQMITAFSVFSVAIFTLLPVIVPLNVISNAKLFLCVGAVTFLLVTSLVLALIVQWRYKYVTMKDVDEFFDCVYKEQQNYTSQHQFDSQWQVQISQIHKSKKKINDKRASFIKASMVVFFVSVGLLVLSASQIIFSII
jgi:hypothetical protein